MSECTSSYIRRMWYNAYSTRLLAVYHCQCTIRVIHELNQEKSGICYIHMGWRFIFIDALWVSDCTHTSISTDICRGISFMNDNRHNLYTVLRKWYCHLTCTTLQTKNACLQEGVIDWHTKSVLPSLANPYRIYHSQWIQCMQRVDVCILVLNYRHNDSYNFPITFFVLWRGWNMHKFA